LRPLFSKQQEEFFFLDVNELFIKKSNTK